MGKRDTRIGRPLARGLRRCRLRQLFTGIDRHPRASALREIAEVRPSAPQPITATSLGLVCMASRTARVLEPQESDQPLPPWP